MPWGRVGFLALLTLVSGSAFAESAGDFSVPITIGGSFNNANVPYVSVTICEPGTDHCQTIPDIELDTGSSGLRLFSSVVTLNLPQAQASGKGEAECVQFGGGDVLWGPVKTADVVFGAEKASGVAVQIADAKYATLPSDCGSTPDADPVAFGGNGILGISPASTDCDGETCPGTTPGKLYYTCSSSVGGTCTALSPSVSQQVQNPIVLLPGADANGVVVSFPALTSPANGDATEPGSLILGIGTRADNQPPASARAYSSDPDGILKAQFQGKDYWTKFDTGTSFWSLPVAPGIAACGSDESGYLCPTAPVDFSFVVEATDGSSSAAVPFSVGNAETLLGSPNLAFTNVAWNDILPDSFLIALPFFFGRDVYVGISGKSSPLGTGPYYGF